MPSPVLGTANLFGALDPAASQAVLAAAYDAGIRRFDTAPSYGYGRTEAELGRFLRGRDDIEIVATKVGILPATEPSRLQRNLRTVLGRLPRNWTAPLRRRAGGIGARQLDADSVRHSVEQSLRRLGHIDRLLLHEPVPADVSAGLLEQLQHYQARGDIDVLGIATSNELTFDCLRVSEALSAAQYAIGPFATPPTVTATVQTRIGHGVLGAAGRALRALGADAQATATWQAATAGTEWAGSDGLAAALLARTADLHVTEVVVATSRPHSLARTADLLRADRPPEPAVCRSIEALIDRSRPARSVGS